MSDVNLERIGWQNGTLISKAKVEINGVIYEVEPEEYSGSTPLSAENLIQMEDNIADAINELQTLTEGTILYSNNSGTAGDITLNDDLSNYSKVEIVYYVSYSDGNVYSTTGKIPVSSRIHLSSVFIGTNSQFNSYCKRLNASGTQITVGSDRRYISTGGGTDGTYTYITEIIGYKY